MAEMAERTHIPLITPVKRPSKPATIRQIRLQHGAHPGQQAKRVAEYATKEQPFKRFAVLYPDTRYGCDLARLFAQEIRQQDENWTASEPYKSDSDFVP